LTVFQTSCNPQPYSGIANPRLPGATLTFTALYVKR